VRIAIAVVLALVGWTYGAVAQVDPALAKVIQDTRAIDNHAHPQRYVAEGQKPDDEFDALPCDTLEQAPGAARTRPNNPEWMGAWRTLYGYKYSDMTPDHVKELVAAKQSAVREHAAGYPAWVLDKAGIDTMFANRVAMGTGIQPPRFRWVPFDDALLLPLNNDRAKRMNSDFDWFYSHEEKLLKRYLADVHLEALPRSLRTYLSKVVTPTMERQKQEGAVAIKLEAAYLRPLNFGHASQEDAEGIYDRNVSGGDVGSAEYRKLQDFLFHYLAQEAGRLGLAVHIHSAPGCGDYFLQRGANPALLETAFDDPSLRKTNFVIVHGGGAPYAKVTAALMQKPNVYADFSFMVLELYPRAFAEVLRGWLEAYPEKVLFGTDASPGPPEMNWEEGAWMAAVSARQGLGMALTSMMNDGEISRERATEIARMVLRENAMKLYGLKP
jgi:predicted TIM-barrel fold metal-dependent hydrolase